MRNEEPYLKKSRNVSTQLSKTFTGELGPALDAAVQERHGLIREHQEESSECDQRSNII